MISFNYRRLLHRTSDELFLRLCNSFSELDLYHLDYEIAVDHEDALMHKVVSSKILVGTLFKPGMTKPLLHGTKRRTNKSDPT